MAELQYEPPASARPVLVEQTGNLTRITVPMTGAYAPTPSWVVSLDWLSLIIAPIWMLATLVIRSIVQLPKPPRAVFEITKESLKMTLHEKTSFKAQSATWPRAAICEIRANRTGRGIWVDVPGIVKETYLQDLPRSTIERLDEVLRAAMC